MFLPEGVNCVQEGWNSTDASPMFSPLLYKRMFALRDFKCDIAR